MARGTQRFRGLRWRLTLTYALTTLVALLFLELVAIVMIFVVVNVYLPGIVRASLQQDAQQAATYFAHGAPDQQALAAWLRLPNAYASGTYQSGYLTITDRAGTVLASVGNAAQPAGTPLARHLTPAAAGQLERMLAASSGAGSASSGVISQVPGGVLLVAVPILDARGVVEGAVIQASDVGQANRYWIAFYARYTVLPSALLFLAFAALFGALYGTALARGFTRRFTRLAEVVAAWSQGDFSRFVADPSGDEIGQLARQLNHMAEQLQQLLRARQALAAVEERNRLARDLHDSVKQQVFALSMQLSAARTLLGGEGGATAAAAATCLGEAETLARQAKQELTALILELRPAALHDRGLAPALREYVAQWSQQTGIAAKVEMTGETSIAADVEEALYRVTQEALSNVARHSHATAVTVTLTGAPDVPGGVPGETRLAVSLAISDNGQGLDTTSVRPGVGLQSMRERMRALGGDVELTSAPGEGTTIVARCAPAGVEVPS
jgi:NarL family two-component system sensor histidine kinase LiaS